MTIQIKHRANPIDPAPILVDTKWYQSIGKAYAYRVDDGYCVYSADDGAYLCWTADAKDIALEASLAEMDRR